MAFSLYTAVQAQSLERIGVRLQEMSRDWQNNTISNFPEYYDLFWLWTLGAYEVLRTMDMHSDKFSETVAKQTHKLKLSVADLRMPFAKQELRGNGKPIYAEASVVGIREGIVFQIGDQTIDSDGLLKEVLDHFSAI